MNRNSATLNAVYIILALLVVACFSSVVYHFFNQDYKTETAIYATASESVSFQGVSVRDETICTYNGQGVVCYNVSDGGKLGIGTTIADIYADETQIDIRRQISVLEEELALLQKIQNPGTSESAQPANLSGLIEERYKALTTARERMDLTALREEKDDILVLLSTYQKITNSEVDFSARIQSLNAQISALESRRTLPLDTVTADRSAYFVSYTDGYESTLTKDSLSTLTVADIRAVEDTVTAASGRTLGKMIDGYEWYMVGVINNAKKTFLTDMTVTLKFSSTSETVQGVIETIRSTGNPEESIVIVRCNKMTHDLVQHRTERVEMIKGEYEGIKVSRHAIRFNEIEVPVKDPETGVETMETIKAKGVYVLMGEQPEFRRLDIIYEGNDYVITSLNAGEGYVSLYDDIIVNGVNADGT
ncbi:MAG: hypothetical protein E7501_08300 [Ruminococcus sp.]|nr:hypothetical protein [Ruminococcus sp.]MBQ8906889.1 hypothetical protein [Ruminococcus sp.]